MIGGGRSPRINCMPSYLVLVPYSNPVTKALIVCESPDSSLNIEDARLIFEEPDE
jgi:hypothetical protein